LNGDNLVDLGDRDEWSVLAEAIPADFDLNQTVDSVELNSFALAGPARI
jgi:hypothetical protein